MLVKIAFWSLHVNVCVRKCAWSPWGLLISKCVCVCEMLWFMEHMLVASSRNTNAHITRHLTAHSELIQYTQCASARLVTLDLGNNNWFLCRNRSTLRKKKIEIKNLNTTIDYLFSRAVQQLCNWIWDCVACIVQFYNEMTQWMDSDLWIKHSFVSGF